MRDGAILPALGATYRYEEIPAVHQLMGDGKLPDGNVACLVNAPEPGLRGSA